MMLPFASERTSVQPLGAVMTGLPRTSMPASSTSPGCAPAGAGIVSAAVLVFPADEDAWKASAPGWGGEPPTVTVTVPAPVEMPSETWKLNESVPVLPGAGVYTTVALSVFGLPLAHAW